MPSLLIVGDKNTTTTTTTTSASSPLESSTKDETISGNVNFEQDEASKSMGEVPMEEVPMEGLKQSNRGGEDSVATTIETSKALPGTEESTSGDEVEVLVAESNTSQIASTPKKRKVTPRDDSTSKEKQQKKVNQMTLSSFFFIGGKQSTPLSSSTGNKKRKKDTRTNTDKSNGASPSSKGTVTVTQSNKSYDDAEAEPTTIDDARNTCREGEEEEEDQGSCTKTSGEEKTEVVSKNAQKEEGQDQVMPSNNNDDSSVTYVDEEQKQQTDSEDHENKGSVVDGSTSNDEDANSKPSRAAKRRTTESTTKAKTNSRKARSDATSERETKDTSIVPSHLSERDLSEDHRLLHQTYQAMNERYLERVSELVDQAKHGLEEEDFDMPGLEPLDDAESLMQDDEEFPTRVVANMALLVEGSPLPLSALALKVCDELKIIHHKEWPVESVCAKIKVLAQRKPYFDLPTNATTEVDLFEDVDDDRLWRWEIITLELLPTDCVAKVRKARSARKKISSYHSAVLKLLKSLKDADGQIFDPNQPKLETVKAKISRDEEKVLKFEREAERQRLAQTLKAKEIETKKKAKEEAAEKKRREKEEATEKKKREKEEAARAREDAKRKKKLEEEQKEQERKIQEAKKLDKQKNTFLSFFSAPPRKAAAEPKKPPAVAAPAAVASGFDVDSFRSKINSTDEVPLFCFRNLSARAVSSRKRRTKSVAVSIFTTVTPEEGDWDAPAFAEQKTIMVPNKYRFLSFHEDCRPAYHGTWSKTSSVVTGKTPFAKETSVFDYDYDSEAEWEEGDDEIGEDVDDDAKNEEEDADEEANGLYDYNDGFCVADEQFLDNEDDADEETRELYMKKLQRGGDEQKLSSQQIQIIAPGPGGVPLHLSSKKLPIDHRIEGFDKKDVAEILSSYTGVTFCSEMKLCLDAFPQLNMDEENLSPDPSTNGNSNKDKDDYTNEVIASMARFAHHCTLNSKEKLIDELRIAHPTLFSNRAKATRKLDSIATKKKHPASTGVYWEVNKDLLLELGLVDLVEMQLIEHADTEDAALGAVSPKDDDQKAVSSEKKRKATIESSNESPAKRCKSGEVVSKGSVSKGNKGVLKPDVSASMKNLMAQFLNRK